MVAASAVPETITGTVRVRSASYNTTANRTKASDAVAAYFASLGIGDDVDLGAIYAAIRSADTVAMAACAAALADTGAIAVRETPSMLGEIDAITIGSSNETCVTQCEVYARVTPL